MIWRLNSKRASALFLLKIGVFVIAYESFIENLKKEFGMPLNFEGSVGTLGRAGILDKTAKLQKIPISDLYNLLTTLKYEDYLKKVPADDQELHEEVLDELVVAVGEDTQLALALSVLSNIDSIGGRLTTRDLLRQYKDLLSKENGKGASIISPERARAIKIDFEVTEITLEDLTTKIISLRGEMQNGNQKLTYNEIAQLVQKNEEMFRNWWKSFEDGGENAGHNFSLSDEIKREGKRYLTERHRPDWPNLK